MPDFYNLTAIRNHNMPEGWRWHSLDCHNKPEGFIEVKGAIPIGVISKGKRKGDPKWPKERQTVWMKFSEIEAMKKLWEQETGKCSNCSGTGQEFAGASAAGTRYRECSECKGTGKQKESAQ